MPNFKSFADKTPKQKKPKKEPDCIELNFNDSYNFINMSPELCFNATMTTKGGEPTNITIPLKDIIRRPF